MMRSPATVFAGDIPPRLKEGFAAVLQAGIIPQFSVHMANLDVAGY